MIVLYTNISLQVHLSYIAHYEIQLRAPFLIKLGPILLKPFTITLLVIFIIFLLLLYYFGNDTKDGL